MRFSRNVLSRCRYSTSRLPLRLSATQILVEYASHLYPAEDMRITKIVNSLIHLESIQAGDGPILKQMRLKKKLHEAGACMILYQVLELY